MSGDFTVRGFLTILFVLSSVRFRERMTCSSCSSS